MFDFVIAGFQKCATTSLYEYFKLCASVRMPDIKEVPYFSDDNIYNCKAKYEEYFPYDYRIDEKVKGLAYVNICYFADPAVPRILDLSPRTKFILVVRDPVDRAFSAYKYAVSRGWETERDLNKALQPDREKYFKHYWEHSNLTYFAHSLYGAQVQEMLKYIPRERLVLVDFESLKRKPQFIMEQLLDFVGGSKSDASEIAYNIHNSEKVQRFFWLQRLILLDNPIKKIYQKLLPNDVRVKINRKVVRPLEMWNLSGKSQKNQVDKKVFYTAFEQYLCAIEEDRKLLESFNLCWIKEI